MRDSTATESPLDALWQPGALIWTVLVVLGLALVLTLGPGSGANSLTAQLEHFGLVAFVGVWVVLLTLGGLYFFRARLGRWDPPRIAWIAFGFLLIATWLICGLTWLVVGELLSGHSLPAMLVRASAIAVTVGLLSLGAFQTFWRNRKLEALARRSELATLHARIHPHFLFNTLNTAIALVRQRPDQVESLLHDLSDLFRAALIAPRQIPIEEEIALCRRYLDIERLRLGERLRVKWSQPEPLPELQIPALTIQPLVENAVRHGVEPLAEGGEISVEITVSHVALNVQVRNPLPQNTTRVPGHHVGQDAVRARIELATRGLGRLEAHAEGTDYVATLTLPLTTSDAPSAVVMAGRI